MLRLSQVMLSSLQGRVGELGATGHTSEDHGDQIRRDATLQGLAQHALLDLPLLQS